MKKMISLLFALILIFGLCGCNKTPEATHPTSAPTDVTEAPLPEEETFHAPSIPQETHIPEASIVTDPEPTEPDYSLYYDLLKPGDSKNHLASAMNCSFVTTAEIDLGILFYGSIAPGNWTTISPETAQILENAGFSRNLELQLRPADQLERILKESFGISLAEIESGIPESWVYVEEDNCYYSNYSDALGFPEFTITWVDRLDKTRVEISYTIESDHWYDTASKSWLDHPDMIMVLEETENGTYLMQSNYLVPTK